MLQSPYFLFRQESKDKSDLTPYEMVSTLSFTIWDEAPDGELINLAKSGDISQAGLDGQIDRLLKSPKSDRFFQRFFGSLLEVDKVTSVSKNEEVFTDFDESVAQTMLEEFKMIISDVVSENGSPLDKLFQNAPSFSNTKLAAFHGLPSQSVGGELKKVSVDGRGSILTTPAFLASSGGAVDNNPFHRGQLIREKLLCMPLPAPPANIPPLVEDGEGPIFETRREKFAAHVSAPSCAGCHSLIDDLGFSLDGFDGVGKEQEKINNLPIVTEGEWTAFIDGHSKFSDGVQMSSQLANSDHLSQCVSTQVFRFVAGREEAGGDGCRIRKAHETFEKSGRNLKVLLKAIMQSETFLKRVQN